MFLPSTTPGVWNQRAGEQKRDVKLTALVGLPATTVGEPITHKPAAAQDVPEEKPRTISHCILLVGCKVVFYMPVLINPVPVGGSRPQAQDLEPGGHLV